MGGIGGDPLANERAPFFAVSLLKLAVMSICTHGLYEIYWFYKNWNLIKQRERASMTPFWRAVFAYFFCYECFSRIDARAASLGLNRSAPAGLLAAGWIVTSFLGWGLNDVFGMALPDPYSWLPALAFVFMLPVQALANRVNATIAPQHDPNQRLTAWNLVSLGVLIAAVIAALIFNFVLPDGNV